MAKDNDITQKGTETLRLGDNSDLVVVDNYGTVPTGEVCLREHTIIIICTKGWVHFEYDGTLIQLQQHDLFLFMARSVGSNFLASPDFKCRIIFSTRSELWNINLNSKTTLDDMSALKLYPQVHLKDEEHEVLKKYFGLLCQRMRNCSAPLKTDIVRSLVSTVFLEILAILRENIKSKQCNDARQNKTSVLHKRRIVDRFMNLLEQSDGRIRKVDDFARLLNVTPKYLSTILKEVLDKRPSMYIHLFTVKAIEHRLRFTDMTMQEIARELSFPNASFFGKYFKEHTHMTPMEYRLKFQKGK